MTDPLSQRPINQVVIKEEKPRPSLALSSLMKVIHTSCAVQGACAILPFTAHRATRSEMQMCIETLVVEEPLEIQLRHGSGDHRATKSISVTMRTPGNDLELAAGFLMTEGVVRDSNDIDNIVCATSTLHDPTSSSILGRTLAGRTQGNTVRVDLRPHVVINFETLERNFYTTSSCGICGKTSLLALRSVCPPRRRNTFSISADVLYTLPAGLREAQSLFTHTGGLHGAALFDHHGKLTALHEDVGRHNAVDKLLGAEFLADRIPLQDSLLLLSGRASFELLQKAVMGGISMVVSIGAPSSLAVQVAQEFDVTLIGFLRDNHFNIYHGAQRIAGLTSLNM